ncbi:MAG TPA: class I SAM-dependent methyltransferase, partial [Phycisphaerae bacterium]|nr:class I SAM-dependent methyltransferase [Phycisphaerae bacterium]
MLYSQADRNAYEAGFWDRQVAAGGSFRRGFYDELNEHLWGLILRELGDLRDRRVLFVGCGTAAGPAKEMARRGADVWCVDISPSSLDKLMRHRFGELRGRIHPVLSDAEAMPFADGSFDVVVGKAIVHHLNLSRFMVEVRRV